MNGQMEHKLFIFDIFYAIFCVGIIAIPFNFFYFKYLYPHIHKYSLVSHGLYAFSKTSLLGTYRCIMYRLLNVLTLDNLIYIFLTSLVTCCIFFISWHQPYSPLIRCVFRPDWRFIRW